MLDALLVGDPTSDGQPPSVQWALTEKRKQYHAKEPIGEASENGPAFVLLHTEGSTSSGFLD